MRASPIKGTCLSVPYTNKDRSTLAHMQYQHSAGAQTQARRCKAAQNLWEMEQLHSFSCPQWPVKG